MNSRTWPDVTGVLPFEVENALKMAVKNQPQSYRLNEIDRVIAIAKRKYPEYWKEKQQ